MSGRARKALRRLGVPDPVSATTALNVALDRHVLFTSAAGPGKVIERLPPHIRNALDDLRSDQIRDIRPDLVRDVIAFTKR
jgi:hypothetical protein